MRLRFASPAAFALVMLAGMFLMITGDAAVAAPAHNLPLVQAPDILRVDSTDTIPVPPIRAIYGAELQRHGKQIDIILGEKTFSCTPGRRTAGSNGKSIKLPLAPFERQDVLYVPFRPLAASLGITYETAGNGRLVNLIVSEQCRIPLRVVETDDWESTPELNSQLYLTPLTGTPSTRLTYSLAPCSDPKFSPDGTLYFMKAPVDCWKGAVCGASSGRWTYTVLMTDQAGGPFWMYSLSPDGRRLLVRTMKTHPKGEDPSYYLLQADGKLVHHFEPTTTDCRFAGNDHILFRKQGDTGLYRYDIGTGQAGALVTGTAAVPSPDNQYVAYVTVDQVAVTCIADAAGQLLGTLGPGGDPVWNRQGDWVVYHGYDYDKNCATVGAACVRDRRVAAHHSTNIALSQTELLMNITACDEKTGFFYTIDAMGNDEPAREGLWWMSMDTQKHQQLVRGDVQHAMVVENGQSIIYTSTDNNGVNNLWLLDRTTNNSRQLTTGINIEEFRLTPDKSAVVCSAMVL